MCSVFCYLFRQDTFVTTCDRGRVGELTSLQVRLDGDDGWLVTTIDVSDDLQNVTFHCNFLIDDSNTCTCNLDPNEPTDC